MTEFYEPANPRLPCFWGFPELNSQLIGPQDVLEQIDHALSSSEVDQPRSFAICGMAGSGQTRIAIEYAHSRTSRFDAIFWLSGEETSAWASSFFRIAVQLGLEEDRELPEWPPVYQAHAVSREKMMQWLISPIKNTALPESPDNFAKWLIIFDNVRDMDALSDYWPRDGNGSVLITSHDPETIDKIRLWAPKLRTINLTP